MGSYKTICIFIFIVSIGFRLPLYHTVFWRTPDAVEYINVARNIDAGKGYIQSIKFNFFDTNPVITSAFHGRPPLTSFLIASILKFNPDLYNLQFIFLVIGSINIVLFYLLAVHFLSPRFALTASLIAAINPNLLISNRLILSEILFTSLILICLLIYFRLKESNYKYILLGVFCGLAYLTRSEGIFLILILGYFIFNRLDRLIALGMPFILVVFPYLYGNYIVNHNPLYSYNYFHFQVRQFQEGLGSGFGKTFPSPIEFILDNFHWVIITVSRNLIYHLKSLINIDYLGLLTVPLLLSLKKVNLVKFKILFIFSFLTLVIYSLLWSAIFETSRHFILVYLLLLLPAFMFLSKVKSKKVVISVLVLTMLMYFAFDVHRIVWARTVDPGIDNWSPKVASNIYDWLKNNTSSEEIISAPDPWLVNVFSEHPTILLPQNLNVDDNLKKFGSQYNVEYYLINDPKIYPLFDRSFQLRYTFSDTRIYQRTLPR